MRELEEMKAELNQITGEKERLEWFENLVKELDKADALNDRKHFRSERRADFDPGELDRSEERDLPVPSVFKTLCHSDQWLDYIFSQRPEDLHELVTDAKLSEALKKLPYKRREALFYRVVWNYSAEEIAAYKGVSGRNIRKLYGKAIEEVRKQVKLDK